MEQQQHNSNEDIKPFNFVLKLENQNTQTAFLQSRYPAKKKFILYNVLYSNSRFFALYNTIKTTNE